VASRILKWVSMCMHLGERVHAAKMSRSEVGAIILKWVSICKHLGERVHAAKMSGGEVGA